jgi:hypothetical protein
MPYADPEKQKAYFREYHRKNHAKHVENCRAYYYANVEKQLYRAAKRRCENPSCDHYPSYGGKGVRFLFASFEQFLAELGPRPSPQHSVDRKNPFGHYEPGNVRWATKKEQAENKRAAYLEARIAQLEQQLTACRSQHAR